MKAKTTKRSPRRATTGRFEDWFPEGAWSRSLPFLVLDARGRVIGLNDRMAAFLGLKRPYTKQLPFSADEFIERWPFFSDKDSSRRLAERIARDDVVRSPLNAESALRPHRIRVYEANPKGREAGKDRPWRLVVVEVIRSGDVNRDAAAARTLERSLSHEMRTALAVVKGYIDVLKEPGGADKRDAILDRMGHAVSRLESVAGRLRDVGGGE